MNEFDVDGMYDDVDQLLVVDYDDEDFDDLEDGFQNEDEYGYPKLDDENEDDDWVN